MMHQVKTSKTQKENVGNKGYKESIIINGEGLILGRLSSFVAKQALLGKQINVINSDNVIVTGKKKVILEKYFKKIHAGKGSQKGPYWSRTSDKMLRKIIRGMLPWKTARGKEAFKRVKCYKETPTKIDGKIIPFKESKSRPLDYLTLGQLERLLKG